MNNIIKYVIIFILFSVVGFLYESVIGVQTSKCGDSIMNMFNLCLPMLTIYGFGAVALVFFRDIFPDMHIIFLSIIATILITIMECIGGQLSLRYNGYQTWDYVDGKYEVCDGYIAPHISSVWFIFILIFYWGYDKWFKNK